MIFYSRNRNSGIFMYQHTDAYTPLLFRFLVIRRGSLTDFSTCLTISVTDSAGGEWSTQCWGGNHFCCNSGYQTVSLRYVQSLPHDWNPCKSSARSAVELNDSTEKLKLQCSGHLCSVSLSAVHLRGAGFQLPVQISRAAASKWNWTRNTMWVFCFSVLPGSQGEWHPCSWHSMTSWPGLGLDCITFVTKVT